MAKDGNDRGVIVMKDIKDYLIYSGFVGGGGSEITIKNQNKTITENGTYTADSGYTGLGRVEVNVQGGGAVETISWTMTENGTYPPVKRVTGEYKASYTIADFQQYDTGEGMITIASNESTNSMVQVRAMGGTANFDAIVVMASTGMYAYTDSDALAQAMGGTVAGWYETPDGTTFTKIDMPPVSFDFLSSAIVLPEALDILLSNKQEKTLYYDTVEVAVPDTKFNNLVSGYYGAVLNESDLAGVTSIGDRAFANRGLKEIHIPANVTYIHNLAFIGNPIETITVAEENPNYKSVDNCLIQTSSKSLIVGSKNSIIPSDAVVEEGAFRGNTAVESIIIPAGVGWQSGCFEGCANLKTLTCNRTSVDGFAELQNLETVNIGETTTRIDYKAFQGCGALKTINLSGVESFGNYAFNGCFLLDNITFNSNMYSIGESVFSSCSSLKSVDLSSCRDLSSIPKSLFSNCRSLSTVILPERTDGRGITKIQAQAFFDCKNLTEINIPPSCAIIEDNAFNVCDNLTELTIPASCRFLGLSSLGIGSETNKATITMLSTTPPACEPTTTTGFSIFYDAKGIGRIIVPAGCGDVYRTAPTWSEFASLIEEATA